MIVVYVLAFMFLIPIVGNLIAYFTTGDQSMFNSAILVNISMTMSLAGVIISIRKNREKGE
jgi:hypothetical protein